MLTTAIEEMLLDVEIVVGEPQRDAGEARDGDMEIPGDQVAQQFVRWSGDERQCHLRRRLAVARDHPVDPGPRIGQRVVDQAKRKRPAHSVAQAPCTALKVLDAGEQPPRLLVDCGALFRQRESGSAPPAQAKTHAALKLGEMPRYRRQGQAQLGLRRSEAAGLDNAAEHLQQAQVHSVHQARP